MEKHLSVIIVNMNNQNLIKDCLSSIEKTTYKKYNVIVSDNGSTDGSIEMIKKNFKRVDLIENKKNLGFSKANNVGIKYALKKYNSDYFFLLNNDTKIIQKNWLTTLVKITKSDDQIGIVGCKLIYPDKSLQFFAINGKDYLPDKGIIKKLGEKDERDANKIQELRWIMGAAFLITRNVVNKIGLLDEKFSPLYGEEIDYCERTKKNNFKIIYSPDVTIIHVRSQTMDPKKIAKDWFITKRHSIRLELLNYSIPEILYWWSIHFGAVFLERSGGKGNVKIRFRKNFVPRLWLLFRAYLENIPDLKEIFYKRVHRNEKIWYK